MYFGQVRTGTGLKNTQAAHINIFHNLKSHV